MINATGSTYHGVLGWGAAISWGDEPTNAYHETPCNYKTEWEAIARAEYVARTLWGAGVVWA